MLFSIKETLNSSKPSLVNITKPDLNSISEKSYESLFSEFLNLLVGHVVEKIKGILQDLMASKLSLL